ncbi:hypothetical protein [Planomonospora sp. ID82291]|nr:hypothetical protein [Planomonospora sp. ID82291]
MTEYGRSTGRRKSTAARPESSGSGAPGATRNAPPRAFARRS